MTYGALRSPLLELGYHPIPIVPNNKYPAIKGWESALAPPTGFPDYGVGVLCGVGQAPIYGVDIDVIDDVIAGKMLTYLLDKYDLTVYRVGRAPKVLAVYRAAQVGIRKITSENYAIGKVEILGAGQQFVAYGIHPDTKMPYNWPGPCGGLADTTMQTLPELTKADMIDIVATFEEMAATAGFRPTIKDTKPKSTVQNDYDSTCILDVPEPLNLGVDRITDILKKIDADGTRDQWRNIGMAIHHELNGSTEGLELWDMWSASGTKYKSGEPENQWASFGKTTSRPLTAAYLLKLDKEAKAVEPPPPPVIDGTEVTARNFFQSLMWSTSRFLKNPPPIPMIIDGMVPKGIVGMTFADGGVGKSTIMLYLGALFSLGLKDIYFIGSKIIPGKVVIVTAEDPELILNHRFIGVVKAIAEELMLEVDEVRTMIDENFSIVSTFGHRVGLFKLVGEEMQATDFFLSLTDALIEIPNLQMVVIDTKTRFSPGEGKGNVTATDEINFYEGIAAKTGATVMLLHHTNKASRAGGQTGKTAFRDASALYDSVRFAWYLRGLTPEECEAQHVPSDQSKHYLLLENAKNNYMMIHDSIVLRRNGYGYEQHGVVSHMTAAEKATAKRQELITTMVRILQKAEGKEWSKVDIRKLGRRAGLSYASIDDGIDFAEKEDLIQNVSKKGNAKGTGTGTRYFYAMTDTGKKYGLTLEGGVDVNS